MRNLVYKSMQSKFGIYVNHDALTDHTRLHVWIGTTIYTSGNVRKAPAFPLLKSAS
jgi:hypothetical protein